MYTIQGVSIITEEGGIACAMYHNGGLNDIVDFGAQMGVVHALKSISTLIPLQPGVSVKWYEAKRKLFRHQIPRSFAELDRAAVVVPTVLS